MKPIFNIVFYPLFNLSQCNAKFPLLLFLKEKFMSQELNIFNFDQELEFINEQPPSNLSCNTVNATNPNLPEERGYQFMIDHRPSVDHGLPIPGSMLS